MSHNKYSSIVYKGKTLKKWAEINGITMTVVRDRLKKGWLPERAISEAPHKNELKRIFKDESFRNS